MNIFTMWELQTTNCIACNHFKMSTYRAIKTQVIATGMCNLVPITAAEKQKWQI